MSPLTRIRDLKSFAPRQRSGLVESDSDACNSFDEPEANAKQPTQQMPPSTATQQQQQQQQPLLSTPLTDANCNSSTTDKITTTSPCSTFLPPSNVPPRESNVPAVHDNQSKPGSQDFGRPNNQQNGNWEKANGNQNENYHYPSGTTDGPRSGNEEMPGSSPWRRSWDVDSNAQSDGGTTTSGSYMVDQDEMTSVYSSNTFIV